MSELRLQTLLCKGVNDKGGMAFKLANRFLVGVSDLFVQVPGFRTACVECKLNKRATAPKEGVAVAVTSPQVRYLQKLDKAGGCGRVASFVTIKADTYLSVFPVPATHKPGDVFVVPWKAYTKLPKGRREEIASDVLSLSLSYL